LGGVGESSRPAIFGDGKGSRRGWQINEKKGKKIEKEGKKCQSNRREKGNIEINKRKDGKKTSVPTMRRGEQKSIPGNGGGARTAP